MQSWTEPRERSGRYQVAEEEGTQLGRNVCGIEDATGIPVGQVGIVEQSCEQLDDCLDALALHGRGTYAVLISSRPMVSSRGEYERHELITIISHDARLVDALGFLRCLGPN